MLKALASNAWKILWSNTKKWWKELDGRDQILVIVVIAVIGIIGYQHIALNHARNDVIDLRAKIANMVTQQQIDSLNESIKDIDAKAKAAQAAVDASRAKTQESITQLNKPYKSDGMNSSQITKGFQSLGR